MSTHSCCVCRCPFLFLPLHSQNNDWPQTPAPLTQASLFRPKWPVPPLQVPEQADEPVSSGWCHLNGTRVLQATTSCSLLGVLLLCWFEFLVFCLWISGWLGASWVVFVWGFERGVVILSASCSSVHPEFLLYWDCCCEVLQYFYSFPLCRSLQLTNSLCI